MASYSTVRYGSRGEDVKTLQAALNSAGYSLVEDGIFGTKTQAAVREYQAKQGLTVDGIVGKNTWGALVSPPPTSDSASPETPPASEPTTPSTPTTAVPNMSRPVVSIPDITLPTVSAPVVDAASKERLSAQLESLIAQFNSTPGYTSKTAEDIRQQAESEYQSYYDQLRLAAQQQQERNDLALAQQRDQLAKTYETQKEESAKQYADAYSTADRQMLSHGMQRSSYAAQTLANINTQGVQAQQTIADAQIAAETAVDEQRSLLAQQLAQQLSQYDTSYAADVLNRIREIENQEYERGMEAADRKNSLSMQIYEIMQQQQRNDLADAQWQAQFEHQQNLDQAANQQWQAQFEYQQNRDQVADQQWQTQFEYQQERDKTEDAQWQKQYEESVRQFNESKKSSSSGGSSSSKKSSSTATQPAASTSGMSWGDFVSALGGGNGDSSSSGGWLQSAVSGVSNAIYNALKDNSADAVSGAAPNASTTKKTVKGSLSSLASVSRGLSK